MSAPSVRLLTPRQQKEARGVVEALLRDGCFWGVVGPCFHAYMPRMIRLHDRARLFLRQTAPKKAATAAFKSPARRKKA